VLLPLSQSKQVTRGCSPSLPVIGRTRLLPRSTIPIHNAGGNRMLAIAQLVATALAVYYAPEGWAVTVFWLAVLVMLCDGTDTCGGRHGV
jgi:hypothetical protein